LSSSLEGSAALVTGAGGGIGSAIAESLAKRGACVGLVGRRPTRLERARRKLEGSGHELFEADLASDEDVRALVRSFLRRFGRLDVLVHSNGTHGSAPFEEARIRDFDRMWAANVRSPYLLTKLLLPSLLSSSGQIVFVNSSVGLTVRAGVGQFAATQHALRAIAETLREELNPRGVRILSVYPGRTATERQRKIFRVEGRAYAPDGLLQPEDVAATIVDSLALPRTAEVTDIRIRPMLKP
jgi:NAD(P)-dependent dehydrogenase (short-subunit alcohol dehydrogenase family)